MDASIREALTVPLLITTLVVLIRTQWKLGYKKVSVGLAIALFFVYSSWIVF